MQPIFRSLPTVLMTLVLLCAALPWVAGAEDEQTAPSGPAAIGESESPALERPPADAHQLERYAYWRARGEAALVELEREIRVLRSRTHIVREARRLGLHTPDAFEQVILTAEGAW